MKKLLMALLIVAVACPLLAAPARKSSLVKIKNGETFNDLYVGDQPNASVQELDEDEDGNLVIAVTLSSDAAGAGMFNPKVKNWSAASSLVMVINNPTDKTFPLRFNIVPNDYAGKTRADVMIRLEFSLNPGDNTINLKLSDLKSQDGSKFDYSSIRQYFFNRGTGSADIVGGPVKIIVKEMSLVF